MYKFLLIISMFCLLGTSTALAACPTEIGGEVVNGVCVPSSTATGLSDNTATGVIENVMNWLLIVIGIIAVIAFVISGMQYLLSGGDQNMIETAKRNMKWSIVGVVVALMGMVILIFIYDILDFGA